MTPRSFIIVAAVVAPLVVAAALLISCGGGSGEEPVQSEKGTPAPKNFPTLAAEDYEKPKFEGDLNGFTFYDSSKEGPRLPTECAGKSGENATPEDIAASPLNFKVSYLPVGMHHINGGGSKCNGVVVSLGEGFGSTGPAIVGINRVKGKPNISVTYPRDRLVETTIAGRAAIIVKPVWEGDRMGIFMRDETSYWSIGGFQISEAELIKVAEGVLD